MLGDGSLRGRASALPAVYGCTSLLSKTVSSLPVYMQSGGTRSDSRLPIWADDQVLVGVDAEVQPSWPELVDAMVNSLLLKGNLYVRMIRRSSDRRQVAIEVLDPNRCDYVSERGRPLRVTFDGAPIDNVVAVRWTTLPGDPKGLGPVDAAARLIGAGMSAERSAARMWKNAGVMPGIIKIGSRDKSNQVEKLREEWSRWYSGAENHGFPLVLSDGEWQPMDISLEAAQFLSTRQWTAAQVAGLIFHIDPSRLGIPIQGSTTLTYTNLSMRNTQFWQDAVQPIAQRIEVALSAFMPRGDLLKFDARQWLQPEPRTRWAIYKTAAEVSKSMGIEPLITPEFILENEGLPIRPIAKLAPATAPAEPADPDEPAEGDPPTEPADPPPATSTASAQNRLRLIEGFRAVERDATLTA